jgi:hypothetical protein
VASYGPALKSRNECRYFTLASRLVYSSLRSMCCMFFFSEAMFVNVAECDSVTGSSVEGDWKPLTVVAELGFSGGEDFLVEIVFASPKMLRMESVYEDMVLERLVSIQMLYIYTSRSLGRR